MSRAWQFTWFYDIEKPAVLQYLQEHKPDCICYVQGGFEICPKTLKSHLQAQFITTSDLTVQKARTLVFALTGKACHFERVKDLTAMTKYNAKDGEVITIGDYPDLRLDEFDEAAALVIAGKTNEVKKSILIKYPSGLASLKKIFYKPMEDLTIPRGSKCAIIIHGPPGTNKDYVANRLYPGKTIYLKAHNGNFDYYSNEDIMIMRDVTSNEMNTWMYQYMLDWADRYAFPAKMLFVGCPVIRPKMLVITSNYSLEDMYPYREFDAEQKIRYAAMRRRFASLDITTMSWSHLTYDAPPAPIIPDVPPELKF